jgi:hypothetical protein
VAGNSKRMQGPLTDTMPPEDKDALTECEADFERGQAMEWEGHVLQGEALQRIQRERLYRGTHPSLEAYCRERWDLSKSRAYQLIDYAVLSTIVEVPNEAVARELAPLKFEPDTVQAVWEKVTSDGSRPTAERVRKEVQTITRRTPPDRPSWQRAIAELNRAIDAACVAVSYPVARKEGIAKLSECRAKLDDGIAKLGG